MYVYSQRNGQFAQQRLSNQAQALAIALPDVNGDGRPDIVVGNDFAMRDGTWAAY